MKSTTFCDQLPEGLDDKIYNFLFLPNKNGQTRSAGTQKQTAAGMAHLLSGGRKLVNWHYDLYSANSGPVPGGPDSNATKTIENGVWNNQHWLTYKAHPEWFEIGSDGKPYFNGADHWYVADLLNPSWQSVRLAGLLADIKAVPGTVGWFCDVFDAGVWHFPSPNQPTRFNGVNPADRSLWPAGFSWLDKMQTWLKVAGALLRSNGYQICPNIGQLVTGWETIDYSSIDGGMVEGFGLWGGNYQGSASDWELQMSRINKIKKPLVLQSPLIDLVNHLNYWFASALMLDNVWLNPCPPGMDSANAFWWPLLEFLDLGSPLESYQAFGNYARRLFSNGCVLVNYGQTQVTVKLDTNYQQATFTGGGLLTVDQIAADGSYTGGKMTLGPVVNSVTLAPGSGAIMIINPVVVTGPKLTLTLADGSSWNIPMNKI